MVAQSRADVVIINLINMIVYTYSPHDLRILQCDPSCYAKILDFQRENGEGDSRIVLIARKNITPGEELT